VKEAAGAAAGGLANWEIRVTQHRRVAVSSTSTSDSHPTAIIMLSCPVSGRFDLGYRSPYLILSFFSPLPPIQHIFLPTSVFF